ncbi:phage integrase N-terminal SAM-like domain-containing protein, partial [bacterium]|nr:phage integrase N-terminal SAM-like domain-containing protein [bacterium]
EKLRVRHYAWRTEQAYLMWIVRFLKFHRDQNGGRWRHPRELGKAEIEQFLTSLAIKSRVAASTQNQALAAILFLYRNVLEIELPDIESTRARKQKRLPVVLSQEEVRAILDLVECEIYRLMTQLLYGTGTAPAQAGAELDQANGVKRVCVLPVSSCGLVHRWTMRDSQLQVHGLSDRRVQWRMKLCTRTLHRKS